VYLDYNATTPLRKEVRELMIELLESHGNPSSSHAWGRKPREVLETAREQVAAAVGADPADDGIFFCSCGTEADQWVLWSSIVSARRRGLSKPHIVSSAVEHPAVLKNLEFLANELEMCSYTLVAVDGEGLLDMNALDDAISDSTCLVSILHSNNEVGSIQDFARIKSIVAKHNAVRAEETFLALHADLAQSVGRCHVDVRGLGLDYATIVGHKMGAPKGVAALYVASRQRASLVPLIHGGGQEMGMRSGTENVMLCGAFGLAIELATANLDADIEDLRRKRDAFMATLCDSLPLQATLVMNGPSDPKACLPNMVSFSVPGVEAASIIAEVGDRVAVSSGSACHTGKGGGGVLHAMGKTEETRRGTFRVSWGFASVEEDVVMAARILAAAISDALH
jgi:cysteine desulfurase